MATKRNTGINAVEESPGRWVVSHHRSWVEGIYDSKDAAEFACSVDPDKLHNLWERRLDRTEPGRHPDPLKMKQLVAVSRPVRKKTSAKRKVSYRRKGNKTTLSELKRNGASGQMSSDTIMDAVVGAGAIVVGGVGFAAHFIRKTERVRCARIVKEHLGTGYPGLGELLKEIDPGLCEQKGTDTDGDI